MRIVDLGLIDYRDAWALQEQAQAEVQAGGEERVFLLEHPPVITFGRRPDVSRNLLAAEGQLAAMGVEVVQSDRGGDITFHGPGQLVAYPIVRLGEHGLSVSSYVKRLEHVVIAALGDLGVSARLDPAAIGVWVGEGREAAKICALGVRIRRGVSMHGIALNVTTDLRYFELINPCGLGRPVTSLRRVMGEACPEMPRVKEVVGAQLAGSFSATAEPRRHRLQGPLPPGAEVPGASRVPT
jgi:lipoyl(octanoyl) transferase